MPWAVLCDFCEAAAPLPDGALTQGTLGPPHQLPEGWLRLGLDEGNNWTQPQLLGLVCSGGCAVRLVARWQDQLVAGRRQVAEAAEAERARARRQPDNSVSYCCQAGAEAHPDACPHHGTKEAIADQATPERLPDDATAAQALAVSGIRRVVDRPQA